MTSSITHAAIPDSVKQFALAALVTMGVLLLARGIAQQVGYGFTNGVLIAANKAEKEGKF